MTQKFPFKIAIIGAGAAVAGGAIAAKGAKSAAKTAAAGSDREIVISNLWRK